MNLPTSVCGTILVTDDVERLAAFYGDRLGLPLVRENHDGLPVHYGVDIGHTHLGIHPPGSFGRSIWPRGGSIIALQVDSLDAWLARLQDHAVPLESEPMSEGFGTFCRICDPDGNIIELVELDYEFGAPEGEKRERHPE